MGETIGRDLDDMTDHESKSLALRYIARARKWAERATLSSRLRPPRLQP